MGNSIEVLFKYVNNKDITTGVIITQWNHLKGFSKETLFKKAFGNNGGSQQYIAIDKLYQYKSLTKDGLIYNIMEWCLQYEEGKGYKLWESINTLLKEENKLLILSIKDLHKYMTGGQIEFCNNYIFDNAKIIQNEKGILVYKQYEHHFEVEIEFNPKTEEFEMNAGISQMHVVEFYDNEYQVGKSVD